MGKYLRRYFIWLNTIDTIHELRWAEGRGGYFAHLASACLALPHR